MQYPPQSQPRAHLGAGRLPIKAERGMHTWMLRMKGAAQLATSAAHQRAELHTHADHMHCPAQFPGSSKFVTPANFNIEQTDDGDIKVRRQAQG